MRLLAVIFLEDATPEGEKVFTYGVGVGAGITVCAGLVGLLFLGACL